MRIAFGTSGWRGVIARDFTVDRVDRVLDALAVHMIENGGRTAVVGGDTRFLSPELAAEAAQRLAGYGFDVRLSDRPVPTPVLSHAVRRLGYAGAVNFTASHNPFMYNGIKFSPGSGGPAPSDVTRRIEELIEAGAAPPAGTGSVVEDDLVSPYAADLPAFIDRALVAGAGLRVVYDAFNGTGSGILDSFLQTSGASVRTIHGRRNPLFDGRHPEPNEAGLADLSEQVVKSGATLGTATDGDADRFGLVDENGRFVSPHDFIALLFEYLVQEKGFRGTGVRSVTTGSLVDRVAASMDMEVIETPVGFKHLGAVMLGRNVVVAGEESGGLSIGGHVPEKDGILACLLACEMCARRGTGLGTQLESLWSRFGRLLHRRMDLRLEGDTGDRVRRAFIENQPSGLAGSRVTGVDRRDGVRLNLDGGSSLLVRLSGTEPLARVYLEADSEDALSGLEAAVMRALSEA